MNHLSNAFCNKCFLTCKWDPLSSEKPTCWFCRGIAQLQYEDSEEWQTLTKSISSSETSSRSSATAPSFTTRGPRLRHSGTVPAAAAAIANSYLGAGERPRKRNRRTQGPKAKPLSPAEIAALPPSLVFTWMGICELHSNYLRKYHVSERLKQHCLEDSPVPEDVLAAIARRMAGKEWSKDNIRQVLRALKQQKYIERWAQIKWRITGERPPPMSAEDMDRVQEINSRS
eukprot:tig00021047_g18151.t1